MAGERERQSKSRTELEPGEDRGARGRERKELSRLWEKRDRKKDSIESRTETEVGESKNPL